jgi:hypothetical protein
MIPYIIKELGVYPGCTRHVMKIIRFYSFYNLSFINEFSDFYWFYDYFIGLVVFKDLKLVIVIRSMLFPL